MALPGIVAGSLLTFIPAVGDFVNAELLGNPQSQMIGNVIQAQASSRRATTRRVSALSFILMAAILIAVLIYARFAGTEQLTGRRPDGQPGRAGTVAGVSARPEPIERPVRAVRLWKRFRASVDRWLLPIYAFFAVAYLALPVLVMIAFSFNDPAGRANLTWRASRIDAWLNPLGRPGWPTRCSTASIIAFLSTLIATILGVLMASRSCATRSAAAALTNLLMFLPMATPEIVLGTSLLTCSSPRPGHVPRVVSIRWACPRFSSRT